MIRKLRASGSLSNPPVRRREGQVADLPISGGKETETANTGTEEEGTHPPMA